MRTPGSYTKSRPVKDSRQRAWNAMRVHKRFTSADIRSTAEIGERNLRAYLQALHSAGYLRQECPRQSGKTLGHAVWRLVRNTGPSHPLVRRDDSGVYDQNQGVLYPYPEVTGEALDRRAG